MSYQVLARKWRPKRFADLVGQEHVVRALGNALAGERLHHAYLLTGTRGVGKTTIARILAKSLNCERGVGAEPCGECAACRQIDAGRFVDLLEIDAASNTGIDNIREVIENAQYTPTAGRYKVYIIDEVHMLSKSAFNAMLKTLEEPPAHVKFILATTDPQKVPVTVLSRCLQFSLRNMTPPQVSGHLAHVLETEQVPYEAGALTLLGRAANGSMRDALSLLDQAIAYGLGEVQEAGVRAMLGAVDRRYLFALIAALADADGAALLAEASELAQRGVGFDAALEELACLFYQITLAQTVPQALAEDDPDREALLALAQTLAAEDVQLYYQIATQGRRDLPLAPDEQLGFNMTLLRMLAFHPAHAPVAEAAAPASPAPAAAARPAVERPSSPPPAGGTGPAAARAALEKFLKRGPAVTPPAPAARPAPRPAPPAPPSDDTPPAPAEPEPAPAAAPLPEPVTAERAVPPWDDAPVAEAAPAVDDSPLPAVAVPLPVDTEAEAPLADDQDHDDPADGLTAAEAEAHDDMFGEPPAAVAPVPAAEPPVADSVVPLAAPAAVPVSTDSPLSFDGDWIALVDQLKEGLGAKARMLAQNAECAGLDGTRFALRVPSAHRFVSGHDYQQQLASALADHFGQPVQIDVEIGEVAGETHLMQRARVQGEKLAAARAAIDSDPKVAELMREFNATLVPESIQPIEE